MRARRFRSTSTALHKHFIHPQHSAACQPSAALHSDMPASAAAAAAAACTSRSPASSAASRRSSAATRLPGPPPAAGSAQRGTRLLQPHALNLCVSGLPWPGWRERARSRQRRRGGRRERRAQTIHRPRVWAAEGALLARGGEVLHGSCAAAAVVPVAGSGARGGGGGREGGREGGRQWRRRRAEPGRRFRNVAQRLQSARLLCILFAAPDGLQASNRVEAG